jgi:glutamate-1-semialdehyde 2,1-aminomutase
MVAVEVLRELRPGSTVRTIPQSILQEYRQAVRWVQQEPFPCEEGLPEPGAAGAPGAEEDVMVQSAPGLSLDEEFTRANPTSQRLFREQQALVPGGYTHATRSFAPFPLFIARCAGSRKWDVDGHEYVDFWMGHGSLLLGHGHPVVQEAIEQQLSRGMHAGGETALAVQWAQLICALVPSAEQVRFMASGGEATQMGLRLARAFTGKNTIVKFQYHFHGWHDAVAVGAAPPFDQPQSGGIPAAVLQHTLVLPAHDLAALEAALDANDDIAGIILEPAGGFNDTIPIDPHYLAALRNITQQHGVVLIFDEVVTGFRYAPGGAQEYFGVTPDLTALGKIMGGGLPVGALAGRADIMCLLGAERAQDGRQVHQTGTWNANPLAAAAGIAALRLIATGDPIAMANRRADQLRAGLDAVFQRQGIAGGSYGRSSIWKVVVGSRPALLDGDYSRAAEDSAALDAGWGAAATAMRQAMLLNGVDTMRTNGFISAVHTEDDVERTVAAFERSLVRLADMGVIAQAVTGS